jgi:hypothetical protein
MYYVMIAEHGKPAVARTLGRAGSSTEARRMALSMDIAMHGRRTGRLFYLDEESFIAWRGRGKAVGSAPDSDPEPAPDQPTETTAGEPQDRPEPQSAA